ncbi:hypothetical protein GCM10017790_71300 [Amycolatopsis oliviviridis]|uniref:Uncharacterized protein n=1 Tax=Amycolatopsis oliviviridis TaxID=1471590 RepID=A0ABQ3M460_9PSEU|nr:hypothetical protein GCM10017790_71300 [Amycolatopsis oliviviridis]
MQIRAADPGAQHADGDVAGADRGIRNVGEFQAGCSVGFDQCLHGAKSGPAAPPESIASFCNPSLAPLHKDGYQRLATFG